MQQNKPRADLTLSSGHGFYSLTPNTEQGTRFILSPIYCGNLNAGKTAILLGSFFADAGDWVRLNVLPKRGLSVEWGCEIYQGNEGANRLWEECM